MIHPSCDTEELNIIRHTMFSKKLAAILVLTLSSCAPAVNSSTRATTTPISYISKPISTNILQHYNSFNLVRVEEGGAVFLGYQGELYKFADGLGQLQVVAQNTIVSTTHIHDVKYDPTRHALYIASGWQVLKVDPSSLSVVADLTFGSADEDDIVHALWVDKRGVFAAVGSSKVVLINPDNLSVLQEYVYYRSHMGPTKIVVGDGIYLHSASTSQVFRIPLDDPRKGGVGYPVEGAERSAWFEKDAVSFSDVALLVAPRGETSVLATFVRSGEAGVSDAFIRAYKNHGIHDRSLGTQYIHPLIVPGDRGYAVYDPSTKKFDYYTADGDLKISGWACGNTLVPDSIWGRKIYFVGLSVSYPLGTSPMVIAEDLEASFAPSLSRKRCD